MIPREHSWLLAHPELGTQYAGEYIAIVDEAVVAHGRDFEAVLDEAEKQGDEPYFHKVPPADKEVIV